MQDKGMSQSDLARALWGSMDTKQGPAARNRDRISKYLQGVSMPDGNTLKLLCAALGVTEEALAPSVVGAQLGKSFPTIRLTVVSGAPELAHVTINTTVRVAVALKLIAVLNEQPPQEGYALQEPQHEENYSEATAMAMRRVLPVRRRDEETGE